MFALRFASLFLLSTTFVSASTTFNAGLVETRQSNDEVAAFVAEIITDVTTTLDGLLGSAASIPALGGLLLGVDAALHQVLFGLEILLAGVLNLVAIWAIYCPIITCILQGDHNLRNVVTSP
ncbi:hypothetical protein C8J57DRAFT_1667652 [Mycena rebaudengoi]|nr:hypothetical protein C8J57DRAFT_1667652 [Mycena rebaudengoi]